MRMIARSCPQCALVPHQVRGRDVITPKGPHHGDQLATVLGIVIEAMQQQLPRGLRVRVPAKVAVGALVKEVGIVHLQDGCMQGPYMHDEIADVRQIIGRPCSGRTHESTVPCVYRIAHVENGLP